MLGRLMFLVILLVFSAVLWYINIQYPDPYLQKGFLTVFSLAFIYLVFKVLFEEIVAKKIREPKARYSFRKAVSITYLIVFLITIIAVWVESPEALLVTYGLIAAAIAVALQDVFKSLAGGIIIFVNRPYKVGDRIEVNSKYGDVIDIDILYTTMLEIREWVDGDQATGRLTVFPNSAVLSSNINNYTKDTDFIWDEIRLPVTYDSDWKAASRMLMELTKKETAEASKKAQKGISRIQEKYYLSKRAVEPMVLTSLTDNWILLTVRYVTHVRERRIVNSRLSRLILERIEKSKRIKIASETLDVVGMPDIKLKR